MMIAVRNPSFRRPGNKIGRLHIGARATVGSSSIILCDSEVGDDVRLDALSLVIKGEKLPGGISWDGHRGEN